MTYSTGKDPKSFQYLNTSEVSFLPILNSSKHSKVHKTKSEKYEKQYHISRTIEGSNYQYNLFYNDSLLFTSSVRGRHPSQPLSIAFNGGDGYILIPNKTCMEFTFAQRNEEILKVSIIRSPQSTFLSPFYETSVTVKDFGTQKFLTLLSKIPRKDESGYLHLNFHNHFVLPSPKNAIFYFSDDDKQTDQLMIRKIAEDTLEIDAFSPFDPLIICGIGLSIYLAKF